MFFVTLDLIGEFIISYTISFYCMNLFYVMIKFQKKKHIVLHHILRTVKWAKIVFVQLFIGFCIPFHSNCTMFILHVQFCCTCACECARTQTQPIHDMIIKLKLIDKSDFSNGLAFICTHRERERHVNCHKRDDGSVIFSAHKTHS